MAEDPDRVDPDRVEPGKDVSRVLVDSSDGPVARDDTQVGPAAAPTPGDLAVAQQPRAIAALDLVDRPAAFEDLDAAIVAELRAIEDL